MMIDEQRTSQTSSKSTRENASRSKLGDDATSNELTSGEELVIESVGPPIRPLTDLGNAERLVDRYGPLLRYCHPAKSWYVYDGRHWARDHASVAGEYAQDVVREILTEAGGITNKDLRDATAKWALQSQSAPRIRAMMELARSILGVPVLPEEFDRDPWLLNCPNGTVDLRDGRLRPHDSDDLLSALCPTRYDLDARAPRWEEFIREVTNGDDDLARFVMRFFGYCLTGITREQVFPILWGPGANGKSVFLDTIKSVVGPDYACEAAPELFTFTKNKPHPTELADLRGRRLVVASETEQGSILRLQLVRRVTGDERLKGRFMFGDFFEFDRTHNSVLVTNSKPVINEDTEGIWRRIRLIPFTVTIPPERRDPRLLERLRSESKGILASLVRACLDWQREGLGTAKVVDAASAEYRSRMVRDNSNSLVRFVDGHCERDEAAFTLAEDLRERYEASGFTSLSAKEFGLAMRTLGFQPERRHGGRGYRGVRLRIQDPDAPSPREEAPCPV